MNLPSSLIYAGDEHNSLQLITSRTPYFTELPSPNIKLPNHKVVPALN